MENKLEGKFKLVYEIKLKTGMHVGASSDMAQIGGVDHPVVRRKDNNQPYIPGSSLKGKIRCLLEQSEGKLLGESDEVNALFGSSKKNISSRIIVRDAYLTEESAAQLSASIYTDLPYTEIKSENSIDRQKGVAGNPRQIERVPAGAIFKAEFIINIWSQESSLDDFLTLLNKGIKLLNDDYLGGSGTRGYGHIHMKELSSEKITF